MTSKKSHSGLSNKHLAFAGVAILAVVVAAVVVSQPGMFSPAGEFTGTTCYDSDPSSSIYTKGFVQIGNATVYDTCISGKVGEVSCLRTGTVYHDLITTYSCPSGYNCSNGICVHAPSGGGGGGVGGGVAIATWNVSGNNVYTMRDVGIGTTNPAAKLSIIGAGFDSTLFGTSLGSNGLMVGASNGSAIYAMSTNGHGIVAEASGNKFSGYFQGGLGVHIMNGLVVSSGNVGIGTTNPVYPLDVNGVIRASALDIGGLAGVGSGNIIMHRGNLTVVSQTGSQVTLNPPCAGSWQAGAPVGNKTAYVWVCV